MSKLNTAEKMLAAGYGKIMHKHSYSHSSALFYNPVTKEDFWETVSDADDPRNDKWDLYHMPINEEYLRLYNIEHGIIFIGATVKVFKGRKIPIGTIAKVEKIKPFYDRYGRWCCNYAYFDDGRKTNIANCELVTEA